MFIIRFYLGSSFGNIPMSGTNKNKIHPRIIHPRYQAPNHRGSLFVIVGVKSGTM